MHCTKCGNAIKVGARFCGVCGAPITANAPITGQKSKNPFIIAALVVVIGIAAYFFANNDNPLQRGFGANVGDIIDFGGYEWRVLDIQGRQALIIMENIWDNRAYHNEWEVITWEHSPLRRELNNGFYNSFSLEDRERIVRKRISNPDNPWFGTPGGNDTEDYIFLLSIDEVVRYFGDSGMMREGRNERNFHDPYNEARIAYEADGSAWLWWLRSPGSLSIYTACVHNDGGIIMSGLIVNERSVGVRPALWLSF